MVILLFEVCLAVKTSSTGYSGNTQVLVSFCKHWTIHYCPSYRFTCGTNGMYKSIASVSLC